MYNAFINNRGQSDGESPKSRGSRRNRRIREDNIPDLDLDVEDPVADASGDFAGEPAVGVDGRCTGFPGSRAKMQMASSIPTRAPSPTIP